MRTDSQILVAVYCSDQTWTEQGLDHVLCLDSMRHHHRHQQFTARLQINLSQMPPDGTSLSTPSHYFQREWIAPPWRERRQREDMKSSRLSGANIDFWLYELYNGDLSVDEYRLVLLHSVASPLVA